MLATCHDGIKRCSSPISFFHRGKNQLADNAMLSSFRRNFIIFNEANEWALIQKFFEHIMDVKPHIFVTYNGRCSTI